jgi:SAM-dependent methyltransferase
MRKHEAWHLSAEAAEQYERSVARYILGPWASLLVDAAPAVAGERVLDVCLRNRRCDACRSGTSWFYRTRFRIDFNPGMIAVARSLPAPIGAPIEWLEGSALELPFADASFDVVLCQQGLQFFPDKALALREMRRALDQGGRLALSVWNSIGIYNGAVGEALNRYVGSDVAVRFCASRRAPTREELLHLALETGFTAVEVRVCRINVHLPRLDGFTLDHLAATPVAPVIAAADPGARTNIGASVMRELQRYADGDGVTYPEETYVLTARAP